MLSGRRLDLLDPSPVDVELTDIAHGLARVARWNGQTTGEHAYSVAQHSLLVEALLCAHEEETSERDRLFALLHDAPEYVIGDMISPFKAAVGGAYKEVEERLSGAVHLSLGLPARTPVRVKAAIKRSDRRAAWLEATRLAGFSMGEADRLFRRPEAAVDDELLSPWPTTDAQARWLDAVRRLVP